MKFVDTASITVEGGHGGAGASSFRREKYVSMGGPDGGKGGDGGNIIIQSSSQIHTLMDLKLKHSYKAPSGSKGSGKNKSGENGKDIIITVPMGTLIRDNHQKLITDLSDPQDNFVVAQGGRGGRGNKSFATSTNQTPRKAQPGHPGEIAKLHLELRLIAEVGLMGLPNAGKSMLLSALTFASPKIAAYPFTTLTPNLGILKFDDSEIVIADIPGLIKGASTGVGLGHDFLRHIHRTKLLIHVLSCESGSIEECWENHQIITKELRLSAPINLKKPTIVVLSKVDIISEDRLDTLIQYFEKQKINVTTVSSVTKQGITDLGYLIRNMLDERKKQ